MLKELTIRVKARGEHFTVGALIRTLERALDGLRALAAKTPHLQPLSEWEVNSLNANGELRITVQGEMDESFVPTYMRGIRALEAGAVAPAEFDDQDLTNARRLVGLLEKDAESITIAAPGEEPVSPTQHVAANVDAILRKRYRYAYGALEGMLETFNVHGTFSFTIFDVLTNAKTVCEFPESMYAQAYAAVRKRVLVTGRVKYNRDGEALTMTVESMRERRGAKDLPQFRAGEEIDMTGGMDAAEYVRGMRDAE